MAISTYSELKTAIGTWLNRTDLSSVASDFITLAEAKFKRDHRLRQVVEATINVSGDYSLPARFMELISLIHDGSTYYKPITMVNPDQLPNLKAQGPGGVTGVPSYGAIIGLDGAEKIRFAPEPDGTYTMKLVYSAQVDPLSDSNTTNALLDLAPDIYLYGALVEAEPYLQEDQRVQLWKALLEEAIQKHYISRQRREFGGNLSRFPANVIGGRV